MAILRFLMIAIGLALIVVAVAAIAATPYFANQARTELARRLTEIVGAEASIGGLGVDPRRAALVLRDIQVASPAPFDGGTALVCPQVRLELDPVSLFRVPLQVRRIHVEHVKVTLQWIPGKGSNLGALLARARQAGQQAGDTGFPALVVDELVCAGATISPRNKLLAALPMDLEVAPFTVGNLEKEGPMRPRRVVGIALRSLVREILTVKGLLSPVLDLLRREEGEAPSAAIVGIDPPE